MRLLKNKKGDVALVTMLITLAIIIVVGLIVTGNLYSTATNMDLGTQGNSTRTTLFNNIYSAFNLAVIIPIVAAAGAIMGVIFTYFQGKGT
ncbi:MAG: hypothetical protein DRP01_05820 [Archaeoglobales archaeon]|nr:MAG: hypothetical protein DRP01_05820 [Archaeoglobales archaeon]